MSAEDEKLEEFPKENECEDIRKYFKDAQIRYSDLKYIITEENLREAVPPLGPRLRFREKLLSWRKAEKCGPLKYLWSMRFVYLFVYLLPFQYMYIL
ncbi:hypothetical protein M5D96_013574 [Drosophila gunungcola]|uniref:Uncharacterized protein n=1 Tax=Drosophila gunungcola TaxID=103775 RepID=A0A9Q0BIC5_9MUSC|nr:hypothetical protein M5D96_013574 [Drosophila gunungcola]